MTDPITALFRRPLLCFWRRPAIDLQLVLRAGRRGFEWLPQGWTCKREGAGWDRSYPWVMQRNYRRSLTLYKGSTRVLEINDTRHKGYRNNPVSGPLLELIARGEAPEDILEEITAFLHEGEKIGRAVKSRHDDLVATAHQRRSIIEREGRERALTQLKTVLQAG